MNKTVDIVVPLQDGGSEHGDMELRYLLRSLCANATGVGRVIIVTAKPPEWLTPNIDLATWLPGIDIYRHNKDGNIFRKVLCGLLCGPSAARTEDVVWTCDDCALLKPCDLSALPVSHSTNGANDPMWRGRSNWIDRMRRTFGYVHGVTGKWLDRFYDSHLPQRLNREAAISAILDCRERWDCEFGGININTAIVPFSMPADAKETIPWGKVKTAYEKAELVTTLGDKTWVSWNDNGWYGGVEKLLAARFPNPCKYERT